MNPPPPGPSRDSRDPALASAADPGSPVRLEVLIEEHGALITALARPFRGMGVPLEDLVSEGRVGLLEAARRWDRRRGVPFARYAVWWIRRQVLRAVRFQGCLLTIPDGDWRRMHGGADRLEMADRIRMPRWFSLHRPRKPGDPEEEPIQIVDERALDPGDEALRREAEERVHRALDHLPERERRVIRWKYGIGSGKPRSLAEAARRLGITRERARQIERRARCRLRDWLEGEEKPPSVA